jgi:chorismate mutase/prephenate dehydratase
MSKFKGLENIERICAHEQSLAQCRGWIRENLPHAELIGMSSNAAGARRARDEDGTAAIGPEVAADVYELDIMANNIEDRPDNATRFLVVGQKLLAPSGEDKTTLLISTGDTAGGAGVLHQLLQPLADHSISMTRIAPVAATKMGLCILYRYRGARGGIAGLRRISATRREEFTI